MPGKKRKGEDKSLKQGFLKSWIRKPSDNSFSRASLEKVDDMASKAPQSEDMADEDRLSKMFSKQLAEMEKAFDKRMQPLAAEIRSLASEMNNLKGEIRKELAELRSAVNSNHTQIKKMEGELVQTQALAKNNQANGVELKKTSKAMQEKLIYMEDYSRRSNIKLINFETQKSGDMKTEVLTWLNNILPAPLAERDLERVHFVGNPKATALRPIIVKFERYADKQQFTSIIKANPDLLKRGARTVQVYQDFSKETADWRKQMKPVTTVLARNNQQYVWGHPVHLKVWRKPILHKIYSLEEGLDLLMVWGMTEEEQVRPGETSGVEPSTSSS